MPRVFNQKIKILYILLTVIWDADKNLIFFIRMEKHIAVNLELIAL
mgnify:CR=1 FL=1